jgi:LytS/YehU family sensor histidine kinase
MHRYTLKCMSTGLVPLKEEMEFVRSYLNIEAVRFRTHLQIDFTAPEDLDGLRLPGLVLQPIVENAIKYGAARSLENSYVRIMIERGVTDFSVAISNNSDLCQPLRPENLFLEGHALKNVSDRLTAVYGVDYGFNIASFDHQVCFKLRIPITEEKYHASASGR